MASSAASARPRGPAPAAVDAGGASLPVRNKGLLTVGVMLATLMQILDTTIANVALPHMQTALGATADTITWVLTSYIVASAIAIPITGWISDRIGSRNLFLFSTVGFIIASALCGTAQSLEEMVLFRILQGVSAAFLNPLSQTVMLDINAPRDQPRAMAIWGMGIMIGPILGPVLGGWLTDNFNWRWVFYVNLPVGVVCIVILWWLLPSRPTRKRDFDVFGFSLLAIGIGALQLMLDRGQGEDWFGSTEIWVEMIIAGAAIWMFIVHLALGKNPMFDRAMWRNRNLVTALAFMLVVGVVMMATMALLPPMLQTLYGYPVVDTGLLLMPRGVGVLITMALSARLIARGLDPRISVAFGFFLAAWSLYDMTRWTLEMGADHFVISGFIQGLGMGLIFMPLNGMAFATLAPEHRTEGASLLNLFRSIGASIGISAVTTILARGIQVSHADIGSTLTVERLQTLDPGLLSNLGGASDVILAIANAEVTRQAAMIAYLDDFKAMMIVTACSIPLVLFMQKPSAPLSSDPAAAGH
ncbi:DHA2 family efflux MFS transporter permease subunit [Sphingomonas sp.]|uniref:DHA2 family efflux MFS transporter permease subunit n=1 Tax=Sphingomonas sp. TaxID=28214 RepID=UPI001EB83339|nr:DHA2 family efflux MFS transporter permease subunit [Sphingomonas sp.]MBX3593870.1 DHA2 family efflux MFS transporter permease subunit [Sphingomonas sp.]